MTNKDLANEESYNPLKETGPMFVPIGAPVNASTRSSTSSTGTVAAETSPLVSSIEREGNVMQHSSHHV